jgi:hypothetical protein
MNLIISISRLIVSTGHINGFQPFLASSTE